MKILAIETSCDETSAAVVEYHRGRFRVFSNVVSSQIDIHKKFGGVVPEVAARKQAELIIPVIEEALRQGKKELEIKNKERGAKKGAVIHNSKFIIPHLDALAVTVGPGLMIALSVGVETARTLAAVWKKPIIAVNHLEGHLYSALLSKQNNFQFPISNFQTNSKSQIRNTKYLIHFPAIALIASGGHTELILVNDYLSYRLLGRTRDDAAGEAYDKVAKLLGLGYPGGPVIDRLAQRGDPAAFNFPRGMIGSNDYDFSFAGLKTAVLYKLQEINKTKKQKNKDLTTNNCKLTTNICASFQAAVTDVLVAKTIHAAQRYNAKTILLGGGVAANSQLRRQLQASVASLIPNSKFLIPDLTYTTDNAAMIAAAAAFRAERKDFTPWQKLKADPNLTL